jgi:hypothetical protein
MYLSEDMREPIAAGQAWAMSLQIGSPFRGAAAEAELRYIHAVQRYLFIGAAIETLKRVDVTLSADQRILRVDRHT